jgi:hypothetical protein
MTKIFSDQINKYIDIYPEENIQMHFNLTNISLYDIFVDPDMFYIKSEEKYGLYELDVQRVAMNLSLDYACFLVPPIFADVGTLRLFFEDLSLNALWKFNLNSEKKLFEVLVYHLLIQVNPDKFNFNLAGYSDLTDLVDRELKMLVENSLNDLLAGLRYRLGEVLQTILNTPSKITDSLNLDSFLPYN